MTVRSETVRYAGRPKRWRAGRSNHDSERVSKPSASQKVLVLLEAYDITGVAKQFLEFALEARTMGAPWAPHVVTFSRHTHATAESPLAAALARAKIVHTTLHEGFRFDPRVVGKLIALVRATTPAIIETHSVKSHAVVMAARGTLRMPWVAFHHGYTMTDLKVRAYNLVDNVSLRRANLAAAVSSAGRAVLRSRGVPEQRICVIPNSVALPRPIDDVERATARRELGLDRNTTMVLAIGRLSREKGFGDLVDTARAMCPLSNGTSVRFFLAGKGPERRALAQRIRTYSLDDTVRLLGYQRDVRPLYAASDILLLTSHSEGAPTVILEAMAYGRPVVATDVGGVPELVLSGHTGIVVPARDPVAAARALLSIVARPNVAQAMGAAGRERALKHFSPAVRATPVLDLYELLGEDARAAESPMLQCGPIHYEVAGFNTILNWNDLDAGKAAPRPATTSNMEGQR